MAGEFVALTSFGPPGSMVNGYNRGDRVDAVVVERWGLTVGEDGQVMPLTTGAVPRPDDDNDDRGTWEAYALVRGWTTSDARAASLDELKAIEEPEPDADGNPASAEALPDPTAPPTAPVRPEDNAVKADWVEYAVKSGADEEWANAKSTTKADLQSWKPAEQPAGPASGEQGQPTDNPADPVAASATAQANG